MTGEPIEIRDVAGLHGVWAHVTKLAAPRDSRPPPTRTLLDVLGIGLEQTMRHLGDERPGFDDFADWIVTTAGPPDPARIERYQAWYDSAPPPASEVARQAAVMATDPVFGAGDLAIWRQEIPHDASANTSALPRLAQYVTMYRCTGRMSGIGFSGASLKYCGRASSHVPVSEGGWDRNDQRNRDTGR